MVEWYQARIELVLAKVIEMAKEIRPDDKKRGAAPAGGPGGAVVCWRLIAFLGAGEERRKGRAAGAMVCRGWLGGGDPAEVCGGNSAVFNQQLTIFLVVAMV